MDVKNFIDPLPEGYDERACMALTPGNQIIVTHPDHPPLLLTSRGQWVAFPESLVHPAQNHSS